ncbi:MAG: succinate dehydrogenase, cytochrome b556 subunit [Paracoccaceae bacterium]|nr:MAG: succinate dehydrogenase, cytochrome b556 subunit [Alphaproteobacteria bacterium]GIX13686.1 MAG: succinate dehydrogenase, cytochrome b556 subunit [Paracoccaceae bacterium]
MADVNRGNRPLSPHLSVYNQSYTGTLSILHRLTGMAMAVAGVLVVWWFLAAAVGPDYFALADWVLTSFLGHLVMIGALWALAYHLCNGIRHLWWDSGHGFELEQVRMSGLVVLTCSGALTVLVLLIANL